MENRIGAGEIFYQKQGTKIRLKDKAIVLTSDCLPEKLVYTYKNVENGETGEIASFELTGGIIIE
jgi:hypothetical protein